MTKWECDNVHNPLSRLQVLGIMLIHCEVSSCVLHNPLAPGDTLDLSYLVYMCRCYLVTFGFSAVSTFLAVVSFGLSLLPLLAFELFPWFCYILLAPKLVTITSLPSHCQRCYSFAPPGNRSIFHFIDETFIYRMHCQKQQGYDISQTPEGMNSVTSRW